MTVRIAYPLPEAAEQAGCSLSKLRQHIRRGELKASYIDTKPVILHKELERWLDSRLGESSSG